MAARPRGCRRWFNVLGGGPCQECLELLAGDDAATADLEVDEAVGAHLVVEEISGQAGSLGGFLME
jgi:hypothetical protein